MPNVLVVGGYASSKAGERTYIAQLDGAANFDQPTLLPRGGDRKSAVVDELLRVNQHAMQGVAPALDALQAQGLITSYRVNALSNTVTYDVPEARAREAWAAMNQVDGIGRITRNREVELVGLRDAAEGARVLMTAPTPVELADGTQVEWNVDRVNAPRVWAQGYTGRGVTIGVVDTGIDVTHPALRDAYRGANPDGTFSDDHNFFDAIKGEARAYDDNLHGTHVSGTIAGTASEGHPATGVAPGAKLIGSKILNMLNLGTLDTVMRGLEWMLAPTDSEGRNADPSKAPDIISNSWSTNDGTSEVFRPLLQSFRAAGIEVVFAAGNAGPKGGSLGAPGSNPEVISVAATDSSDQVAPFSSRGPSPIKDADGSDRKPDIAAPGDQITSTTPWGSYTTLSGTSMATPLVSGVIALLLSKHRDLTHEEIVQAITTSAKDIDTPGYDYNAGHGLIDAEAALEAADAIVAARDH